MNCQKLINQIKEYKPYNEQEERDKILILDWIRNNENAFSRENTVAHMTASAWVVNRSEPEFLWYITIFTTPGPGLEDMRMGRRIFCLLQSGR